MIEITIQGLNARQKVLADILWACDTRDEMTKLIKALPTKELKHEAEAIVNLMIMAAIEQAYDGIAGLDEANDLINRVSK